MYFVNKIVGAVLNPLGIGLLLSLGALLCLRLKKRKARPLAFGLIVASIAWLWVWSCGVTGRIIGLGLERDFPPQLAEELPSADAIVVLGGGMSWNTNACPYADIQVAADRAWHAARLYRAGKAKCVFTTLEADAQLLVDFGVPRAAISVNEKARNTEEEARFITCQPLTSTGTRPRVLLVTSAWHMRRALLMYARYATDVEVVPAATDHWNTTMFDRPLDFRDFLPDSGMIGQNAYLFKEWLGYYGYRFFRNCKPKK